MANVSRQVTGRIRKAASSSRRWIFDSSVSLPSACEGTWVRIRTLLATAMTTRANAGQETALWKCHAHRERGNSTFAGTLYLSTERLSFVPSPSTRLARRWFGDLDWECRREQVVACSVDKGSLQKALSVGWSFYLAWPLLHVELTDGTRQRFLVRSPGRKAAEMSVLLDLGRSERPANR